MEARRRKAVQRARVIEVEMGHDHRTDRSGIDADKAERLGGFAIDGAAAALRLRGVETGVNHNGALGVADHPDEEVHGVGACMVVGLHEAVEPGALAAAGVLHRQNFVSLAHGVISTDIHRMAGPITRRLA